ncbi:hypothetical protein D3C75_896640 [compost metagenome]
MLDLDVGHLDAPGVGLRVEHLLDVGVEPLALGQHVVQLVLAEHRAQGGLRQLAGRRLVVLDLDDRLLRIEHPVVDHRVDLHRDVVTGDHVLGRHIQHDGAQIDAHHLLDAGDEDDQSRSLDLPEAAELEHHPALVLAQDAEHRRQQTDQQ